jgi:hypothetical protein
MIAYNNTFLNNLAILKKCRTWFANNLISVEQMGAILKNYPANYYDPNLFIRIGLFLFMWLMIGAALGLYSLITLPAWSSGSSDTMRIFGLFTSSIFGGLSFLMLEKFIKEKNWFGNGMDDALLYSGLSSIFSLIVIFAGDNLNGANDVLLICFLFLPMLTLTAMRYLDRLVTLAALICFYCICFLLIMKTGSIAKFIMPFAFIALSAGLYVVTRRFLNKEELIHYQRCLTVVKAVAMVVFYVAGNYFVIRESSVEYFGLDLSMGQDIPMAVIFYTFTALVPLGYLFYGLKKKDKLMVWVALLLIAISVLTFKYYFSLGHPEITLTTAGLLMILLAYASIRYLNEDRYGITFKDDPNEDDFLKSNAEALIIARSFGSAPAQPSGGGVEFGGGEFGGAGSGDKY